MHKYFEQLQSNTRPMNITDQQICDFKKEVVREMKLMGAKDTELGLVDDNVIFASIQNHHTPKELAWAIMQ